MVQLDLPPDLASLISLSVQTDNRLQPRKCDHCHVTSVTDHWWSNIVSLSSSHWNPSSFPPPRLQRTGGGTHAVGMGSALQGEATLPPKGKEMLFYCSQLGHLCAAYFIKGRGDDSSLGSHYDPTMLPHLGCRAQGSATQCILDEGGCGGANQLQLTSWAREFGIQQRIYLSAWRGKSRLHGSWDPAIYPRSSVNCWFV